MKKFTLLMLILSMSPLNAVTQGVCFLPAHSMRSANSADVSYTEFSDDFESGMENWIVSIPGFWGLSTVKAFSPLHSLAESEPGNYKDNQVSYCTMIEGVDLTAKLSAEVSFYAQYEIEEGFDFMYVDVSNDDFTGFSTLAIFDGVLDTWTQLSYSLGGFCGPGNENVKVRFRFISDPNFNLDGMYIDDFVITSSDEDHSPPMIMSNAPEFYEGSPGEFVAEADIIDISGLALVQCSYTVDGLTQAAIPGVNTSESHYTFTIPAQPAGANVDYIIEATDASAFSNNSASPAASYIAGEYYKYDNAEVSYYIPFSQSQGASVMFSLNGPTNLATALIRNYTDAGNPNGKMLFHIWAPNSTLTGPGSNLITPFMVTPEASPSNTMAMTRIDLRPYSPMLSNLTGDFFVGFTVPASTVNLTETVPDIGGRSFFYDGSAWVSVNEDFHFRVITSGSFTGLHELTADEVRLYPNPMNQYAFVKVGANIRHPYAKLYNLTGREISIRQVTEGDRIQVFRSNLSSGMYLLYIYDDNKLISQQKLIVK